MSNTPVPRRFSWGLALLWLSPLLFLLWWFYITSPAPQSQQSTEFSASLLSNDPIDALAVSKGQLLIAHQGQLERRLPDQTLLLQTGTDVTALTQDLVSQQIAWASPTTLYWQPLNSSAQHSAPLPCPTDRLQFATTRLLLRCTSGALMQFELAEQRFSALLPTIKVTDLQLDADKLWLLSSSQLQQYQWPELILLQQIPTPASATLLALWQHQPVLAQKDMILQLEQKQWQPLWQSEGRIQRLLASDSALFYQDQLAQADIWLWPATADKPQLKLGTARAELLPVQNSQGTLAYLSRGSGADEIWLRPKEQNPYRLTALPATVQPAQLAWSSDHQWLWLVHDNTLYRLSVQTQQLQAVWSGHQAIQQFALLGDDKVLLLSEQQLSQLQWQQGQLTALNTPGVQRIQAEDNSVLLQLSEQAGLWRWSEAAGLRLAFADLPVQASAWQLQQGQLWFDQDGIMHRQALDQQNAPWSSALPQGFSGPWSVGQDGLWYSKTNAPATGLYQLQPTTASAD